jgi:putative hemolysin
MLGLILFLGPLLQFLCSPSVTGSNLQFTFLKYCSKMVRLTLKIMPKTAVLVHDCGNTLAATDRFRVGMAQTLDDVIECQRLRYLVFNCELGEGLDTSAKTGLDRDRFDFICDHLMVRDAVTGKLAGTYRMQSGYRAKGNIGYYGEGFFDFRPFERIRGEVLELGRACVHEEYRNSNVLSMLWKGIAKYAESCGARYLIGCSSLSSQDENEGMALYEVLREKYLVEPSLRTNPVEGRRCKSNGSTTVPPKLPRLFRAYLDISARVCGPPAIDREFRTIDFLTLVDLQVLPDRVRTRFF